MKTLSLFFLLLLLTISISFSQSEKETILDPFPNHGNVFSIMPQYAITSGFRLDYERKLPNPTQWIVLAPQLYLDTNGEDNFNDFYDEMSGFGINLYFKQFVSNSHKDNSNGTSRTNIYFLVGPTYQYFDMMTEEQIPEEYVEDGNTYIRFNEGEYHSYITRLGLDTNFGIEFIFGRFVMDIFTGVGIRYAFDKNGGLVDYNNELWIDHGYSGILLNGGVKFGFIM